SERSMTAATSDDWVERNQRSLMAEVGRIRRLLERDTHAPDPETKLEPGSLFANEMAAGEETAIDDLARAFGLSPFERDLLLLCAGAELDARFPPLCAAAIGDPQRP